MGYRDFIKSKVRRPKAMGFEIKQSLNPLLKPFQSDVVSWSIKRGRAALFEECGFGKSFQELEWARLVCEHTGGSVILLCPLGVRDQFIRESKKFGISDRVPVRLANDQSEVGPGINIANYEKLRKFDARTFAGVVLDESSILKSFTGAIKQALIEAFKNTPYRLCGTATAAPNDLMELGNHAEFLGVMPSNEMLSRWFINDTMKAGGYVLRPYGAEDFWDWVASWAVCLSKPSDLGYSNEGYDLPPIKEIEHVVSVEYKPEPGFLFPTVGVSATDIHKEKRLSVKERAAKAAEIVAQSDDYCIVWCDTDYEADALLKVIPDALEVRGSQKESVKESRLAAFATGEAKILVTKPTVAGFGLNFQHCNRCVYVGPSFSYEQRYQSTRRIWRFGQERPVFVHTVLTDGEEAILRTVKRKERMHKGLKSSMALAMKRSQIANVRGELMRDPYEPTISMEIPEWLTTKC